METDGIECTNTECHHHDLTFSFSCDLGENEVVIEECWDRQVARDPATWVMRAIRDEVRSARNKFPHNKHLLGALVEEVGELAQALLQGKTNHEIQRECIQVACVAIRIFEERDADYDEWTTKDGQPRE